MRTQEKIGASYKFTGTRAEKFSMNCHISQIIKESGGFFTCRF